MKEFEEWWNKHRGGALENFELDKRNSLLAWKAALEWVKRELPRAEAGFINPDLGLGEILKKELEE